MAGSTDSTKAVPNLYHPLDADKQELRLLEICPSKDSDSPIQVKIFPRRFEDVQGQFIPFSYVWGDPTDTETIIINGISRKVTKNLALFLRQVRVLLPEILANISWEKPALFWADAICINQDDTEERNRQVQLMGSIYGAAPMVLAWLGQAEDSHLVGNMTDACVVWMEACKEKNANSAGTSGWDPNCNGWMERYPEFWSFSGDVRKMNPYWEAIRTLLLSPYWERTWIFQEITLPADTLLMYGSTLIRLSSLPAFGLWMVKFLNKSASDFPFLDQASYQDLFMTVQFATNAVGFSIKSTLLIGQRLTIQERPTLVLVSDLADLRASDPRDKIFSLLGVMDTHLTADYSKPVAQVYCEFVSAWMYEVQNLNFLLEAYRMPYVKGSKEQPGLPSWVPDWGAISLALNEDLNMTYGSPLGHSFLQLGIRASAHLPLDPAHIGQSSRILTATGVVCDQVQEVYPTWIDSEGDFIIGTSFFDLLQRFMDSCKLERHGRSRRHIFQILFRTSLQDTALVDNSREEIFGDVKWGEPDVAHWQDAEAAFQWAWENHMAELESIRVQSLFSLGSTAKFLTQRNYMGVTSSAEVGDKVVVLAGCDAPVLLRPKDGHYEHIGPCFVLGLMDGEAKDMVDRGEAKIERFEIH
ncbi:hypothetical protein CDV36_007606 [Fusarium kuroshium]|uniref:Heterokaryon incompatibility domain-containing protein n=2 Tax=Fusarium solani species complex TaxID=232080 RepID=A0A3M2S565_9HYPO|nr:hypothetical protein CDV36_007606 [Fusarium kuroshium]RSL76286.1 hypothetical protein CEP51_010102 [Fusarium floridanum]